MVECLGLDFAYLFRFTSIVQKFHVPSHICRQEVSPWPFIIRSTSGRSTPGQVVVQHGSNAYYGAISMEYDGMLFQHAFGYLDIR